MSLYDRQGSGVRRRRRRPSTIVKKNISEATGPIFIKFDMNHHWVGGLIALGFRADYIKIVVSMATVGPIDLQWEKLKTSSSLKVLGPHWPQL